MEAGGLLVFIFAMESQSVSKPWRWQHIEHLPTVHLSHPSPSAEVANSFNQVAKNWDTKEAKNRDNPLSCSGPEALAAGGFYYNSLPT